MLRTGILFAHRGGPRLTAYGPDGAPARAFEVPGSYGHWVAPVGDELVVGIGTRSERYATLTRTGETVATFGVRRPAPSRFPAGNFIVDDHQAVAGDRILVNTSFSPRIRVYDTEGDPIRTFGEPPPSWTGAEPPSPGQVEGGSDEEPIVAGGDRLYTLGEEPPGPWTIHAYEWVGEIR